MKVLIVSHTVLSRTSNMGRTLLSYFQAFKPGEVAQLYIHSEVPTDDTVCQNYYRFTDKDALKSIVPLRHRGTVFGKKDIQVERVSSRTDTGLTGQIYQFGRRRTASIYLARNTVWKCSHWFTKELKKWLDDFAPDVVFFASGDYAFAYDIARKVTDYVKKPLVVSCVDDYYINNRNEKSLLGKLEFKARLKAVHKTLDRAACILSICDSMTEAYSKMFPCPCYTLHTMAKNIELVPHADARQISYLGNLGYNRHLQLVEMGRALRRLNRTEEPTMIDVYSGERLPEITGMLTEENGIRFHGQISAEEVREVMRSSIAVIHTEAFDEDMMKEVYFSVSTKIAESLMYGPCLIAYGPEEVASMAYLKKNNAACVISSREELEGRLQEIIENAGLREEILKNARRLGFENHNMDTGAVRFRGWLENVAKTGKI